MDGKEIYENIKGTEYQLLNELGRDLPMRIEYDEDFKVGLTFEFIESKNSYVKFEVNIAKKQFGIFAAMFKKVSLGGEIQTYSDSKEKLYLAPHFSYTHPDGGSNGSDMCDGWGNRVVYIFDLKNKKWFKK